LNSTRPINFLGPYSHSTRAPPMATVESWDRPVPVDKTGRCLGWPAKQVHRYCHNYYIPRGIINRPVPVLPILVTVEYCLSIYF